MDCLPPHLHSLSTHTYGTLTLQLLPPKPSSPLTITHFHPQFFGQQCSQNINSSNEPSNPSCQIGTPKQYKLLTNLWMFYLYLSDMEYLTIYLRDGMDRNGRGMDRYFIRVPLELKKAKQVMREDFRDRDIIKAGNSQPCAILDSRGNTYGSAVVKIWTDFDIAIHEEIKELVNFNELVVFQGISPINSETELPREPPQQLSILDSRTIQSKTTSKPTPNPNTNFLHQPLQSSIKAHDPSQEQQPEGEDNHEYRIMEEDIDKLIREMQQKPYDCSRYQEGQEGQGSSAGLNWDQNKLRSNTGSVVSGFSRTEQKFHNSIRFVETEASFKHSMARPPSYSPTPRPQPKLQPQQQSIMSKSPQIMKASSLSNPQPHPQQSHPQIPSSSYIQLKIHQMLTTLSPSSSSHPLVPSIQPTYTLKLYLNNDKDQYFAAQGIKQGQVVIFNQSLKVRNLDNLQKLRFLICDDYGVVEGEGVFGVDRLYGGKDRKGVFTVALLPPPGNPTHAAKLKVSGNRLEEVYPLHRTLRIQAQLIQKVQIVQIFLKLQKISITQCQLRYKIPTTKQPITDTIPASSSSSLSHTHINIFPHSLSPQVPQKLTLQFWRNEQNIGQSEISLKNIKNINAHVLAAGTEPIYLYEGKKQIRNMLDGDRLVGDYLLTLCFGSVGQMQGLLLAAIKNEKEGKLRDGDRRRVNATLDQRLGVLVCSSNGSTMKPVLNNISIQVQMEEEHPLLSNRMDLANKFMGQPSFGDQSMISHTSHNEFMEASLVSFAKNQPQQHEQPQHYIHTLPKPTPTISHPTITQRISQTLTPLLSPLIPVLPALKQQSKPFLVYNFLPTQKLKQILLKLGIKQRVVELIFKCVLFSKGELTNVNILYDFVMGVQVDGMVRECLLGDQVVVVGALRLLYGREGPVRRQLLLQSSMQFKQMADLFKQVQLKLTLNEYKILDKFISRYKSKQQAQQLKAAVIAELESQTVKEMQEGFYEQDILRQIYGEESSLQASGCGGLEMSRDSRQSCVEQVEDIPKFTSTPSPNPSLVALKQQQTPISKPMPKPQPQQKSPTRPQTQSYPTRISIDGIENTLQSLQCIFDPLPKNLSLTLTLSSPIKKQLSFQLSQKSKQFASPTELKDIDGTVKLMSQAREIACAAFSLIKGVKSLYALKNGEGEFCGLLHLLLE